MAAIWDVADVLPQYLSRTVGSEIAGVRLFCSLLYVYPITVVQRLLLNEAHPNIHHIYNTLTAASLLYFNFGISSGMFFINVLLMYLLLHALKSSRYAVILSIILNTVYLSIGYAQKYFSKDTNYQVTWSTSHCILTLKLISLTWDVYDGAQKDQKGKEETVVASIPTFLEMLGYSYFPPGVMTGPPVSFMKYKRFTEGEFAQHLRTSSSWSYGLQRLIMGIVLTVSYPLLTRSLPLDFFYTEEFKSTLMVVKVFYIAAWGHILLCRYTGVWLVAEGCCIISGIAFNGTDENGEPRWDASANVKLVRFLSARCSSHYIESFSINTNKWALAYVYKRLRFLNNKQISQLGTMLFLSVWHGFGAGYFMCFFFEFIVMNCERQIVDLVTRKRLLKYICELPILGSIIEVLTKILATFTLGYGLISFEQLSFYKSMEIFGNMNYVAHIFYMSWPLAYLLLSKTLQDDIPKAEKQH